MQLSQNKITVSEHWASQVENLEDEPIYIYIYKVKGNLPTRELCFCNCLF